MQVIRTTMKLICQQLQLVIVIMFACPTLAIEECIYGQPPKPSENRPICAGADTELFEGSCFRYFNGSAFSFMAEVRCRDNDAVLAAFKSLSQMQNIFKGLEGRQSVWVGANDESNSASFRWIANKKRLRHESPMWSNEHTREERPGGCLVRNTNLLLSTSNCYNQHQYICMNLYSKVLTVNVNDELKERNAEILILRNSSMTIECLAETTNNSIILSISFKDHVIMTVSNQSRLVYDVDNARCEDAGIYSCNVDFTDSGISVEYFIFIDMDCPATVTLSIDQLVATPSHHIMTSLGSELSFNCTVNYAKEDFYVEILKNDKVITTQNDSSTVTFNLSVTGCNDSDVYTCRYTQPKLEAKSMSSPLLIGVHHCPTHILSFDVKEKKNFKYDYYDVWPDHVGDTPPEKEPGKYFELFCYAETYSRPTTLLIKSDLGNVLNSKENESFIYQNALYMTCMEKGKVVCQITDHLRNETDSKSRYIWVRRCEPSLCRQENNFKRLVPHLSQKVRATFCFMMDRTLHTIKEKQLFHDGRLLEANSTSKHVINIKADRTNPYQYTLDLTLVNVKVEDFGQYLIHLKFNDKTVLTFLVTVQDSVQSPLHGQFSTFISYGLPCVFFLLLVIALVAIYSIFKKKNFAVKNASNSGDVAQVNGDGIKYTTIREDLKSFAP